MPLCKGPSLEMLGSRMKLRVSFSLFVDVRKKLLPIDVLFICLCVIVIVALLEAYPLLDGPLLSPSSRLKRQTSLLVRIFFAKLFL